jgi:hypothetical protein
MRAEFVDLSPPKKDPKGNEIHEMRLEVVKGEPQTQSVSHVGGLVIARSDEEAAGLAKARILELWPESDGWTIHSVLVKEVPEARLEEALERLRAGDSNMLIM